MALIRYKRLNQHPEGVHRVANGHQDILFNAQVNDGLVDVRHQSDVQRLTQRCPACGTFANYEIALEKYGVTYDAAGVEQEPQLPGVVEESPIGTTDPVEVEAPKRGRPKKK